MANFDIFNKLIDPIEGTGAVPGEKSKFGVTEQSYEMVFKKKKSFQDITYNEAVEVRRYFWNKMMGDNIKDQDVANIFIDAAFNTGFKQGTLHLQRALIEDFSATIKADGKFGPLTLAALNSVAEKTPAQLFNAIRKRREKFYLTECKASICPKLKLTRLDPYFPEKKDEPVAPPKAEVSTSAAIGNSYHALMNPQAEKNLAMLIVGGIVVVLGIIGYVTWNNKQLQKLAFFNK